jgi:hypothetical protein
MDQRSSSAVPNVSDTGHSAAAVAALFCPPSAQDLLEIRS